MLRCLVKTLTWGLLVAAVLGALIVAGFLQELAPDDIRDAAGGAEPLRDPWIEVSVQRMTLSLHDGERLVKRYSIGYGKGPSGRVANRKGGTPYGEYTVVRKVKREHVLTRGSRFLVLDFPSVEDADRAFEAGAISPEDHERIIEAHARGEPPPTDTPLGGPLGIQGNFFFFRERRFTDGSIALRNADINELYEHVPVGTRVTISH